MGHLPNLFVVTCICLLTQAPSRIRGQDCSKTLHDVKPDWNHSPWSCQNRCGQTYSGEPCACDAICTVYRDCCEDFAGFCSPVEGAGVASHQSEASGVESVMTSEDALALGITMPGDHVFPSANPSAITATPGVGSSEVSATPRVRFDNTSRDSSTPLVSSSGNLTPSAVVSATPLVSPSATSRPTAAPSASFATPRVSSSVVSATSRTNPLAETVECRGRARLVSACPHPLPTTPKRHLLYLGRVIAPGEIAERCQTPWEEADDEDVLQMMPVTDAASGHHYLNVYCLLCHGGQLEDVKRWSLDVVWYVIGQRTNVHTQPQPANVSEVIQLARSTPFYTVAVPPAGVTPRRCLPEETFSPFSCSCPELEERCSTGPYAYINGDEYLYRNVHCLLCHILTTGETPRNVIAPDANTLALSRSPLQFSLRLFWEESAANRGLSRFVLVTVGEAFFVWRKMVCDRRTLTDDANPEHDDPDNHNDENVVRCTQTSCNGNIPVIYGVCRRHFRRILYHAALTCTRAPSGNPGSNSTDKTRNVNGLRNKLRDAVKHEIEASGRDVIVYVRRMSLTDDLCTLNAWIEIVTNGSNYNTLSSKTGAKITAYASLGQMSQFLGIEPNEIDACVAVNGDAECVYAIEGQRQNASKWYQGEMRQAGRSEAAQFGSCCITFFVAFCLAFFI